MTDLRQTPEYAQYMKSLGWQAVSLDNNLVYLKNIPLIGKIAKLQRPKSEIIESSLTTFIDQNKVSVFYIEPNTGNGFKNLNFKTSKSCFLPSKTIHMDLKLSEQEILKQIKKKTRYSVRLAQKQNLCVTKSQDVALFIKMWEISARKRGMWLPQKKEILSLWNAFKDNTHCLIANSDTLHQKKPLAGVLIVRANNVAYYMYAFSTQEGNKLSAPTFLVWEAIKLAKKKNCEIFDFEGIYDKRYPQTKNWKGFTKFKEGFGGEIIEYPQTIVRYSNTLLRYLV